jgi:putative ABC transport system permease protein
MPAATPPPSRPLFSEEFTISGVVREFLDDKDYSDIFDLGAGDRSRKADVFLPARTAVQLFSRDPRHTGFGFPGVIITVDREDNVKHVARDVRNLGLQEYSLVEIVKLVRTNVTLFALAFGILGAVALLVAALGICNIMIMAVLERTRDIGIMKAVGARDGDIRMMFLVEGLLVGLMGGGLGVLFGWGISFVGDSIVRALILDPNFPPLENSLFDFPWWLTLGSPLGAGLVTTLAALYPAWRATKVNPITALRHE